MIFIKISEILQSNPESVISKIGKGPYLYYGTNGKIYIDCDLQRILKYHMQNDKIVDDAEIYAYGFKKEENDNYQYINADDLKKRFEEMEKEDIYEIIEPQEQNGIVYQVPLYCGFEELSYFYENRMNLTANCKSINNIIEEEFQKRIIKSDTIRK